MIVEELEDLENFKTSQKHKEHSYEFGGSVERTVVVYGTDFPEAWAYVAHACHGSRETGLEVVPESGEQDTSYGHYQDINCYEIQSVLHAVVAYALAVYPDVVEAVGIPLPEDSSLDGLGKAVYLWR